ncbi:MAG: SPOR domain-containing protein [Variovorax sp.]|nr:MAG: SPOR domain-containing protein [Variovorax sp.]
MPAARAAPKTLPLPSYVRVRNPANGREAIVRVNDRGPFHADRVIDLSYTAALQLDLLRGVAPVEIERITNEDIRTGAWRREAGTAVAQTQPAPFAGGVSRTGSADGSVVVPSAWAMPVASVGAGTMPVAPPASLAPTAPASASPPAVGTNETTSRGLVVTPLPPMAPAVEAAPPPSPASTAPLATPAPAADAEGIAGFWVQLGAFRERAGADQLLAQASRSVPALAARLTVFTEAGTHRLQAGPYPSREAAGVAVAQVRDGLRIAPLVVERR